MKQLTDPIQQYIAFALLLFVLTATPVSADNDQPTLEELSKNAQALTDKLQDYTDAQREDAIRSISKTLKALDKRIDALDSELEENWDDMSEATRENAKESLEALQAQREKVAQWYERLKDSSSIAWSSVRKDFSDAYEAFSDAWLNAEDEVEGDEPSKLDKSI